MTDSRVGAVTPPIAVITPVRNGERFIKQTLDSILAQTFRDFVVVVVDDASTDGTRAILDGYTDPRIQVIHSDCALGAAGARNRALDQVRSRYVAFCDSDDISDPQRFERQYQFLEAHPHVQFLAGAVAVIDENGTPTGVVWGRHRDDLIAPSLLFGNCFATSSVMVRRVLVGDTRMDQRLCPVEDYDFWTRIVDRDGAQVLSEVVAYYRTHAAGITSTLSANTRRSLEEIARRQLVRIGVRPTAEELQVHLRLGQRKIALRTTGASERDRCTARKRRTRPSTIRSTSRKSTMRRSLANATASAQST